jgi:hypothetical protein
MAHHMQINHVTRLRKLAAYSPENEIVGRKLLYESAVLFLIKQEVEFRKLDL